MSGMRMGFIPVTNLIIHHSIADTFNHTTKFVRILDVVKKTLHLRLLFQCLEFSVNATQFPNDPYASDSTLFHERCKLTVPVPPSSLLPGRYLQKLAHRVR
jgi:hypothetical protein